MLIKIHLSIYKSYFIRESTGEGRGYFAGCQGQSLLHITLAGLMCDVCHGVEAAAAATAAAPGCAHIPG